MTRKYFENATKSPIHQYGVTIQPGEGKWIEVPSPNPPPSPLPVLLDPVSGSLIDGTGKPIAPTVSGAQDANGVLIAPAAQGAYFPNRMRRGTRGRKIASWTSALQNSGGTAARVQGDLPPFADGSTYVLKLTQNVSNSFGQQNPLDGGQAFLPAGGANGFTVGIWAKNPGTRTLNFRLTFYNPAANHQIYFNGACEPGDWRFLTFSPSQKIVGAWTFGTDSVAFFRVEQYDAGAEGAWLAGESLLFGNAYVNVAARPRFLITFDDGVAEQSRNNPGLTNIVSGAAYVSSTAANVLTTAAAHSLLVGEPIVFTETPPTSLTVGTTYYVQTTPTATTFTLATDAALQNIAPTDTFAGIARYQYAGSQSRTLQEVVEQYGFRGSLFIVPSWLGTSGVFGTGTGVKYMSGADVVQMWKQGWAVGSHSNTHPFNAESAGLRLLGPYGYYLSNTFDNLPTQYLSVYNITSANGRRRVVSGSQASPSVFTTEAAHQFTQNQPIVFTDVAPTGCQLGVTYYVASAPTATTFTLATDQGTQANKVNNTVGAWAGLANYRHPGSAPDDSAIYADIVAGAEGVKALGIPTGYTFFALPQGAADQYVRSACIRAGFKWIRGISNYNNAHTIPVGLPSGGGLSGVLNPPGGWLQQLDAVQTDGTNTLAQNDAYISDTITQGACGCCYHHGWSPSSLKQLERLCQTLRTKSDAGLIDVMTLDEYGREIGIA